MPLVDLDLNVGELKSEPANLYSLATVVSVACGGHIGDPASMARAVSFAMARGARIAAHPSYPDREAISRASLAITGDALAASIEQQCAALQAIARKLGFPVALVKPHGALLDDATIDPELARAFLDGATRGLGSPKNLTVVGAQQGALREEALRRGFRYAREAFADRAYAADGKLIPTSSPSAHITDRAAAVRQAVALASGTIEMLCVRSDTPEAILIAGDVREALIQNGYLANNL
jgi:UPF0271 protein